MTSGIGRYTSRGVGQDISLDAEIIYGNQRNLGLPKALWVGDEELAEPQSVGKKCGGLYQAVGESKMMMMKLF